MSLQGLFTGSAGLAMLLRAFDLQVTSFPVLLLKPPPPFFFG